MNNKQQTAVEWYADKFADHLEETYGIKITSLTLLKQAKEMEKEQMIKFAKDWYSNSFMTHPWRTPEQYYNETYGGNNERQTH
jgi:hypothetical protein